MSIQRRYRTSSVAPRDKFAFWREAVCESYVNLGCETDERASFHGELNVTHHPLISVSQVSGSRHQVTRRPRDIRNSSEHFFLLSLQRKATSRVSQFGRDAVLGVGDMALYSSDAPYQLSLSDSFRQTVIQMPAAQLIKRLPQADMLAARRIACGGGVSKLARDALIAFSAQLHDASGPMQAALQDTVLDLIATALIAVGAGENALSTADQHVLLRAQSFIRAHLHEPMLDRTAVSAEVGLSVRRVNEVFAKQGVTVTQYIRTLRLEAVADCLRDPRFARRSIGEIAFGHGFQNYQSFTTLFRKHYDESPKDFRRRACKA